MFDEPFADPSQISTFLVSQLARQKVTVSLSGDGGDELFGGYARHLWVPRIWNLFRWLPPHVAHWLTSVIQGFSSNTMNDLSESLNRFLPQLMRVRLPGDKLYKLAAADGVLSPDVFYQTVAATYAPGQLVIGDQESGDHLLAILANLSVGDSANHMMFVDSMTYLPDDILTKLDRCSMAVSLEGRVPLLDHRVIEFAWRLPLSLKLRGGVGKWILRQVLYQYVPRSLVDRPKAGFDLPIDAWLRGPLREWAAQLLHPSRLHREGLLNATLIQDLFNQHLSGKRNWRDLLWAVLMFELWRERWMKKTS